MVTKGDIMKLQNKILVGATLLFVTFMSGKSCGYGSAVHEFARAYDSTHERLDRKLYDAQHTARTGYPAEHLSRTKEGFRDGFSELLTDPELSQKFKSEFTESLSWIYLARYYGHLRAH